MRRAGLFDKGRQTRQASTSMTRRLENANQQYQAFIGVRIFVR